MDAGQLEKFLPTKYSFLEGGSDSLARVDAETDCTGEKKSLNEAIWLQFMNQESMDELDQTPGRRLGRKMSSTVI